MNKYAITAHLREVCQEGTVLGVIKKNKVDMKHESEHSTVNSSTSRLLSKSTVILDQVFRMPSNFAS